MWALPVLALGSLAIPVLLASCGGAKDERVVTYENALGVAVNVAVDGVEVARIEPGATVDVRIKRDLLPDRIEAFEISGNPVHDETVTWEQLEARGWRVVIQ